MAEAADEAGIQFRVLNRSKGPAIWATRAQVDRIRYARAVQQRLDACANRRADRRLGGGSRDGGRSAGGAALADGRALPALSR